MTTEFQPVKRGRIWKLPDNVDTDVLAPFDSMNAPWDERRAAMLSEHRDLIDGVAPGDILVAGRNFGCGSSREPAAENLKRLGFAAVLAESYARIFFRNCVAIAFPALVCPGVVAACEEADELEVDIRAGRARNLTRGTDLAVEPYAPEMIEILERGGLLEVLRK